MEAAAERCADRRSATGRSRRLRRLVDRARRTAAASSATRCRTAGGAGRLGDRSFHGASAAALDPPTCLLPNDRWRPDNDLEYCSASIADTRRGLAQLGPEFDMLRQYLEVFHPTPEQLRQNGGKIQVPLVRQLTIPAMAKLRSLVRELRAHVELVDCSSPSLLTERIEQHLLQAGHGFEVVESGMFELWRRQKWSDIFKVRPDEKYFVRNVAKFGYSATERPTPMPGYVQELAEAGDPSDDEVMLVSYQYGAAARKSA